MESEQLLAAGRAGGRPGPAAAPGARAAVVQCWRGRGRDRGEASLLNRLPVPSTAFYGRQSELSVLRSTLHSVCATGKPMMASE